MSILSLLFLSFVNIYLVLSVAGFLKTLPPIRQAVFFFVQKPSPKKPIYILRVQQFFLPLLCSSFFIFLLFFSLVSVIFALQDEKNSAFWPRFSTHMAANCVRLILKNPDRYSFN